MALPVRQAEQMTALVPVQRPCRRAVNCDPATTGTGWWPNVASHGRLVRRRQFGPDPMHKCARSYTLVPPLAALAPATVLRSTAIARPGLRCRANAGVASNRTCARGACAYARPKAGAP